VPAEKPTSEQVRLEAEQLRATAIQLMEKAATLIEKSEELEKQISMSQSGNKSKET
jgi:hypothetical protein